MFSKVLWPFCWESVDLNMVFLHLIPFHLSYMPVDTHTPAQHWDSVVKTGILTWSGVYGESVQSFTIKCGLFLSYSGYLKIYDNSDIEDSYLILFISVSHAQYNL